MDETTLRPIQFRLRTLLIAMAACGALFWLILMRPRHEAAFRAVEPGMSKSDVMQLLGEPQERLEKSEHRNERWIYPAEWHGRHLYFIDFDDSGERVTRKRIDDTWFQF